jgi:hypothetical protein
MFLSAYPAGTTFEVPLVYLFNIFLLQVPVHVIRQSRLIARILQFNFHHDNIISLSYPQPPLDKTHKTFIGSNLISENLCTLSHCHQFSRKGLLVASRKCFCFRDGSRKSHRSVRHLNPSHSQSIRRATTPRPQDEQTGFLIRSFAPRGSLMPPQWIKEMANSSTMQVRLLPCPWA